MKKIVILLLTLVSLISLSAFAACTTDGGDGEAKKEFSWLETTNQTREIGTLYNMSAIWGKYDGEYISPEISVKKGGASVAEYDSANKILPLYELGDYNVTVTFSYKDENEQSVTVEKKFVVTSVDSTAPSLSMVYAERLFTGAEINLNDIFVGYDSVDKTVVTVEYTVKNPQGETVSLTDNKFTADLAGNYTVSVTVSDSRNNSASKDYELYVRDGKIFESFRLADESGVKGYTVNGRDFEISSAHAEGDGECLHITSVEKYNHAYVRFDNSKGVKWSQTNGLLFTVYNDKSETVFAKIGGMIEHTDIWGTNFVLVELNGNARNTVYVSAEELASVTSDGEKWLYFEICYEKNGNKGFKSGQIELYLDDVLYASEAEAEQYKFPDSLIAEEINGGATLVKTSVEKSGQRVKALQFKPNGTWMRFYFTKSSRKWSKIKSYSVAIYNPSANPVGFKFGSFSDLDALKSVVDYGTQLVTLNSGWNTVKLDVTGFNDDDYLFVGVGAKDAGFGNTADNFANYTSNGVFFSEFVAVEYTEAEYQAAMKEKPFNSIKGLTGVGSFEATDQVKYDDAELGGTRSLYVKMTGTWCTAYFDACPQNYKTDEIKSVTMWLYNPSQSYDFKLDVGYLTADDVATSGYKAPKDGKTVTLKHGVWTKVTLNTSAWVDGAYIAMSANYTFYNSTTSKTEEWQEFNKVGFYVDGFVFKGISQSERDELDHDNVVTDIY